MVQKDRWQAVLKNAHRFSRINATIHIFTIFDAYASPYCDLDPWPFDLISMSQPRYTHDPISVILAQIVTKILYSPGFSGHCPLWPWPLTFDFLIPKANQHIYEPKYICDQNWVKFPSLAFEILCSQGHCLLWPWPVTFPTQKLISRSMNPNTSVTKIEWNSLHWFSWYGVHKVFGTHRLTHSLIHSRMDKHKYRMPMAPLFNGVGCIKMKLNNRALANAPVPQLCLELNPSDQPLQNFHETRLCEWQRCQSSVKELVFPMSTCSRENSNRLKQHSYQLFY